MDERTDEINGITLHSYTSGDPGGAPVVFLHGFPEWGGAWKAQLRYLAARGCYCVAPDQRGYGQSSKPRGIRSYTTPTLAADIAGLIGCLGTGPVTLVGHDWGGGVAWEVARRRPDLVRRLVILNMPHPDAIRQVLRENGAQRRKSWYIAFFQLPLLPEACCSAFGYRLLRRTLQRSVRRGTFSESDLNRYRDAWAQPGALRGMLHWYRALRYHRPAPFTVALPTLLLWGRRDAFLEPANAALSLARCTQGTLRYFDNATHWLHHEEPEAVSEAILGFIREC
ncbi:alpha/beta hydrolase [Flaviaesturariibacter amylovorans]|uniref:Epoxide hydrolase EphM n=1 Tax=Flaviaesturariibacter amylovorans TaxID=1084520 RepID=A0ABP8HSD7_9BACT